MKPIVVAALPILAAALFPACAHAQWSGQVFAGYNTNLPNLSNGQSLPLQIDSGGNLKVDCILGCSGGGTSGTVSLTQGGATVGPGNGLVIQDPSAGTAITGASMPSGGSGMIGWMSALSRQLGGTILMSDTADGASPTGGVANAGSGLLGWLGTIASELGGVLSVRPAGISGAPTVSAGSLGASGSVISAEGQGVRRLHLKLWNFAPAGGANLYCSDDGSTPTSTNASFIVYAQGGYERDAPGWVPSAAISCVPSSGTVAYRAESYP